MIDAKTAALSLVEKYRPFVAFNNGFGYDKEMEDKNAKACAIIDCKNTIEALDEVSLGESGTTKIDYGQFHYQEIITAIESM